MRLRTPPGTRGSGNTADTLLIEGFAAVDTPDYARTLEWDRAAKAAGYAYPA